MTRIAVAAFAALLLAPPALAADGTPTPTLVHAVTVDSDVVRVGDLVANAGAASEIAIFRSPDLGTTGSVSAARVLDAIRPYNLIVVDTGDVGEIEVTRAGRAITPKDLEARIARAFAGQYGLGDAQRLSVTFDRDVRTLYVEASATADLQVMRSAYDQRSGRFDVTLSLPGSGIAARAPMRYSGVLVETIETAVLNRPLGRGEVIRPTDISIERRARNEVVADAANGLDEVTGLAARQPLRPGQALRRGDLMKPEIVKHDDLVTIVYEAPGIMLTIRGKAIDSGAQGDLVNVLNIQSKRTLQGTVSGPGRVTVAATAPAAVVDTASAAPVRPAPAQAE